MWQKARFIKVMNAPFVPGDELWVTGPVHLAVGVHPITGKGTDPRRTLYCNLLAQSFERCSVAVDDIELLGDPDAFCEEPPFISFLEWAGVSHE